MEFHRVRKGLVAWRDHCAFVTDLLESAPNFVLSLLFKCFVVVVNELSDQFPSRLREFAYMRPSSPSMGQKTQVTVTVLSLHIFVLRDPVSKCPLRYIVIAGQGFPA